MLWGRCNFSRAFEFALWLITGANLVYKSFSSLNYVKQTHWKGITFLVTLTAVSSGTEKPFLNWDSENALNKSPVSALASIT